jgi:hypothetical protein
MQMQVLVIKIHQPSNPTTAKILASSSVYNDESTTNGEWNIHIPSR